jgi:hypothetical protein
MSDKRKSLRRLVRYKAWLVLGADKRQNCYLSDISETGARIDIDQADEVPDRFLLWLAANGAARRLCHVVWRKPRQIGVTFEQRLADDARAALQASRHTEPAGAV